MYIDGNLEGLFGERHRVSGLETMQFTTSGIVPDSNRCVSMSFQNPGDLIYGIGLTRNELGGSEYYEMLGYTGLNVPRVIADEMFPIYKKVHETILQGLAVSVHGVYRGGLGVHLALCSMAGETGITVDLSKIPVQEPLSEEVLAYSETAGRFIISVSPSDREKFEALFSNVSINCIGRVETGGFFELVGKSGEVWLKTEVNTLKTAWKNTYGSLV